MSLSYWDLIELLHLDYTFAAKYSYSFSHAFWICFAVLPPYFGSAASVYDKPERCNIDTDDSKPADGKFVTKDMTEVLNEKITNKFSNIMLENGLRV